MKQTKPIQQIKLKQLNYPLTVLALFFFLFISSTARGATYYVDATNGNDNNAGISQSSAWKTIAKVNASNFQPGDFILFKRGEIWKEQLRVPSSGQVGAPITLGAYGTGDKPIITARDSFSGWNITDNWTHAGENSWFFELDINPWRVWLSSVEYLGAETPGNLNSISRWFWDDDSDRLHVYSTGNPAKTYADIEGAQVTLAKQFAILINSKAYLTFQNLDVRGGFNTLSIVNDTGGANYLIVEDCNIGLDAGRYGLRALSYNNNTNNYGIIRRNTIDSGMRLYYELDPFSFAFATNDGIELVGCNYWEIYDNEIFDWGHNAVNIQNINSGYTTSYNKIYNNLLTAEYVSYGRGITFGGLDGTCQYNEFFGNIVRNTEARNQIGGDHNSVYYNIIDKVENSPITRNDTGQGISLEGMIPKICHHNKIYNNVIVNTDEAGIQIWGYGSNEVKGNEIKNNIIINCGNDSKDEEFENVGLVIKDFSSVLKGNVYQNNLIYSAGIGDIVYYWGNAINVSEFNNKNGNNGDTINGNIQSDPKFVDISGHNFQLKEVSPCIDAGLGVGLLTDYAGNSVPQGPGADIGAFEYNNISQPTNFRVIESP